MLRQCKTCRMHLAMLRGLWRSLHVGAVTAHFSGKREGRPVVLHAGHQVLCCFAKLCLKHMC